MLLVPLVTLGLWLQNEWKDGNEVIAEELVKLDRLQSIATYRKVLGAQDSHTDDRLYDDLFLKEGTGAVVSADLLTFLKQMAATRGVEVVRAGELQPKTEGPITLVGGSLEMSGRIPDIFGFVQQIEAAKPLLFLDSLTIRSNSPNGTEDKSDTLLMVEMHVFGAVRSKKLATVGTASP